MVSRVKGKGRLGADVMHSTTEKIKVLFLCPIFVFIFFMGLVLIFFLLLWEYD